MTIPGTRAVVLLNRTQNPASVTIDWNKLGLAGTPQSVRDVWRGQPVSDAIISVPAEDLVLLLVQGQDRAPITVSAKGSAITEIPTTSGPTFGQLKYVNTSGEIAVMRIKSTSGLSTAFALPPTSGSAAETMGLILPHGTADLSVESPTVTVRELNLFPWKPTRPD